MFVICLTYNLSYVIAKVQMEIPHVKDHQEKWLQNYPHRTSEKIDDIQILSRNPKTGTVDLLFTVGGKRLRDPNANINVIEGSETHISFIDVESKNFYLHSGAWKTEITVPKLELFWFKPDGNITSWWTWYEYRVMCMVIFSILTIVVIASFFTALNYIREDIDFFRRRERNQDEDDFSTEIRRQMENAYRGHITNLERTIEDLRTANGGQPPTKKRKIK
jgi:hypothetical protein